MWKLNICESFESHPNSIVHIWLPSCDMYMGWHFTKTSQFTCCKQPPRSSKFLYIFQFLIKLSLSFQGRVIYVICFRGYENQWCQNILESVVSWWFVLSFSLNLRTCVLLVSFLETCVLLVSFNRVHPVGFKITIIGISMYK